MEVNLSSAADKLRRKVLTLRCLSSESRVHVFTFHLHATVQYLHIQCIRSCHRAVLLVFSRHTPVPSPPLLPSNKRLTGAYLFNQAPPITQHQSSERARSSSPSSLPPFFFLLNAASTSARRYSSYVPTAPSGSINWRRSAEMSCN